MNVLAFVAFLLALILLIIGVHVGWVIWLVVVGGLILSVGFGPSWSHPWTR